MQQKNRREELRVNQTMDHQDALDRPSVDVGSRVRNARKPSVFVATEEKDLHEDVQHNTETPDCQLLIYGMCARIARMLKEEDYMASSREAEVVDSSQDGFAQ